MKAAVARKPIIKIAVVESDPLRFVGFRALFDGLPWNNANHMENTKGPTWGEVGPFAKPTYD